jgi:hypothetical protein
LAVLKYHRVHFEAARLHHGTRRHFKGRPVRAFYRPVENRHALLVLGCSELVSEFFRRERLDPCSVFKFHRFDPPRPEQLAWLHTFRLSCTELSDTADERQELSSEMGKPMALKLAIVCVLACSGPALAQSGITNQRDAQGNLVRDNGTYAQRGVNQGPVNNGPIRNAPPQPPTANTIQRNGANR